MPVEIDETELANLRSVQTTVAKMLDNPKARKLVLQARKEVDPAAIIPELDAAAPVMAEMTELRTLVTDFIKSSNERESKREEDARSNAFARQFEQGRAKLRGAGYQDEGIAAIEKLMEQKGIVDHEDAEAIWRDRNPPPPPAVSSGSRFDIFNPPKEDDAAMKALMAGDDETFLRMTVPDAILSGRRN